MNLEDLKKEYFEHWVSPNGLGLLDRDGEENANGVLFLGYIVLMIKMIENYVSSDVRNSFIRTIDLLRVAPGLFNRRPQWPVLEAHDNYSAIVGTSRICGLDYIVDEILAHGERNAYNYNNLAPFVWKIECQRQGGEIAFYKINGGKVAEIWNTAWLVLGTWAAAWTRNYSSINLSWYKYEILKIADQWMPVNGPTRVIIGIGEIVFRALRWARVGGQKESFKHYFKAEHPIHVFAEVANV